ncbi:SDR family oxidoreductase [Nonomuraea sp. NPDC048826]|uniref:SDR family oxidoreductase n=1 Tax=Nonomuraea sp. NPDC048826 TaxID=3364347 RepID=UPI00371BF91A
MDGPLGQGQDAADWPATESVVARTLERFGALDAAVANAGFMSGDSIVAGDPASWALMVLTNVLGPALLAHAALPHLEATGGRLVLISSVAGLKNSPANLYSATKWATTVTRPGCDVDRSSPGVRHEAALTSRMPAGHGALRWHPAVPATSRSFGSSLPASLAGSSDRNQG